MKNPDSQENPDLASCSTPSESHPNWLGNEAPAVKIPRANQKEGAVAWATQAVWEAGSQTHSCHKKAHWKEGVVEFPSKAKGREKSRKTGQRQKSSQL